jgi:hypothetical protein
MHWPDAATVAPVIARAGETRSFGSVAQMEASPVKPSLALLVGAFLPVAVVLAAELNLGVTSGGQPKIVVQPGQVVEYEVSGFLSDSLNEGLSHFIFDLTFSGGSLEPADAPTSLPLLSFAPPAGYSNPSGFGGTAVDGSLKQIGGTQNTLKAPSMIGPVVTGVGHVPIVLATGMLTAPLSDGVYTLGASNVLARVIKLGEDGRGEIWATEWAWEGTLAPLVMLVGESACLSVQDCADENGDSIRDDPCLWWSCSTGSCQSTEVVFADVGGQFGNCLPDGTADGNDRFHALNCFANVTTDGSAGYPCEGSPPAAFNVDIGGPFGDCQPDGVCDGNDAFHAINAFQGTTACSCESGPSPTTTPEVLSRATLVARPRSRIVQAGSEVEVDVFLEDGVSDLRGYQLHLMSHGGDRGSLELVDMVVHTDDPRYVFHGQAAWQAFNVATAQMVAGLDGSGITSEPHAYLATFVYRASANAKGRFTVELLLGGDSDRSCRTFLFPTPAAGRIELAQLKPTVVEIFGRRELRQ